MQTTHRVVLMAAVLLCPSLFGLEGFLAGLAGGGGCTGTPAKAAVETQGRLRRVENKTRGRPSRRPWGQAVMPLTQGLHCEAAWHAPNLPQQ